MSFLPEDFEQTQCSSITTTTRWSSKLSFHQKIKNRHNVPHLAVAEQLIRDISVCSERIWATNPFNAAAAIIIFPFDRLYQIYYIGLFQS